MTATHQQQDDLDLAAIERRWAPYLTGPFDPELHRRFAALTGRHDDLVVPEQVWWERLLPRLNDLAYREAFRDKNLSDQLLGWPPGPETYLRRVHGHYLAADYTPIADAEVLPHLQALQERGITTAIIKPSRTDDGERIALLGIDERGLALGRQRVTWPILERLFGTDLIVQERLVQHPAMAAPHPASVNTVRLRTLRWHGRIEVLPSLVRFGQNGSINDNVGTGGLACGVEHDGRLRPYAVDSAGGVQRVHPTTGVAFADREVPRWGEVVALGQRLHRAVLPFDLVGWDIALDRAGRPRLLEFNVRGDSNVVQHATGQPLFGAWTAKVIDALLTD